MRPYPMSGNSNRSCDRLSVSHPAHRAGLDFCTESASCADSVSCSENIRTISDYVLAMAYVPWQHFSTVYEPDRSLSAGTIFPELDKPFLAATEVDADDDQSDESVPTPPLDRYGQLCCRRNHRISRHAS